MRLVKIQGAIEITEINLMAKYPKTKRDINNRGEIKTKKDCEIAKLFGKEFFDGNRKTGYGGFNYHPRFWSGVVNDIIQYYNLQPGSKILDIGCAKGFMLHDFKKAMPELLVEGIDISEYAINNCKKEIKSYVRIGDARKLSQFEDKEFDIVISITTLHNLKLNECKKAIQEIQRIGKNAFIVLDAWRNEQEHKDLLKWALTAETMMHVDHWKKLFDEVGYTGDYYWFIAD